MSTDPALLPRHLRQTLTDLADDYTFETVVNACLVLWPEALAVPSATARAGDPSTSQASGARVASRDVGMFSRRSDSARLLGEFCIAVEAITAQEATRRVVGPDALPSRFESCRRRVSDLYAAGYIVDVGLRKNEGSPDHSNTFAVTSRGHAASRSLSLIGWSK